MLKLSHWGTVYLPWVALVTVLFYVFVYWAQTPTPSTVAGLPRYYACMIVLAALSYAGHFIVGYYYLGYGKRGR